MTTRSNPDQFQLRLPAGLRARIKAYADQHGRSMNTEIIRVLQQEFPEPITIDEKIAELVGIVELIKTGKSTIGKLSIELMAIMIETANGRIKVDDETRRQVQKAMEEVSKANNERGRQNQKKR